MGMIASRRSCLSPEQRSQCAEMLCEASLKLADAGFASEILASHLNFIEDISKATVLLHQFCDHCTAEQLRRVLPGLHYTPQQYCDLGQYLSGLRKFDLAETVGDSWEDDHPSSMAGSASSFLPWVYWRQLRYEKALTCFESNYSKYAHSDDLVGQAIVLGFMGRYADSAARYKELETIQPISGDACKPLAMALFGSGDVRGAMERHEGRVLGPAFVEKAPPDLPRWNGDQLQGGLLVLLDPGWSIGDYLMYARYIPLLRRKVARVRIEAPADMHAVLRAAYPEAELVTHIDTGECEAYAWLMSLPVALQLWSTVGETLPWLRPDEERTMHWKRWWAQQDDGATVPRPRIGLCWRGNPNTYHDRFRSIAFEDFVPLLAARSNIDWVNLQLGSNERPGNTMLEALGSRWLDPMPGVTDFMDTAALIATLDCVLTIDSAVAHICGSTGVHMVLLVPIWGEWRWQTGEHSLWYPNATLVRTPADSSFRHTIMGLANEWPEKNDISGSAGGRR